MNKRMLCVALAFCLFLLSGCTFLPFGKNDDPSVLQFAVPVTVTSVSSGQTTVTDYVTEKVIKREDGLYEVFCRTTTEGSSEEGHVRFLFDSNAVLLGQRDMNGYGNQDSVGPFDSTWDSYVAGQEEKIKKIEKNRIYYVGGGYEDLDLYNGRITKATLYGENGEMIREFTLSRFGQLGYLRLYKEDGTVDFSVQYTYNTVKP